MPKLTDPMDGLRSFKPAFSAKQLEVFRGELDTSLWVHRDTPAQNVHRLTYAYAERSVVTAIAIIIQEEPIDGLPCFGVGYAVDEAERGKGLGKRVLAAAIAEFRNGIGRAGVTDLWFEAVVGAENHASQAVASAVLDVEPRAGTASISGEAVLVYARRYRRGE